MINVNNITSTLAKLPDQALQQYAMMHKSDPYIMSLAVSESNRRKEMRTAQGAQGGMQEQPKVVDAAVAEMAPQAPPMPQQMGQPMPEDSGIGQLPAGDMEFAGGGILAFAEGDSIPGPKSAGSGKPLDAEAQALIRQSEGDRKAMLATIKKLAAAGYDIATLLPRGVAGAFETAVTRPLNALGVPLPYLPESFYGGDRSSMTPAMDALRREDLAPAPAPAPAPRPAVPAGSTIESDAMRNRSRAAVADERALFEDEPADTSAPNPLATPVGIAQVEGPTVTNAADVSMDYAGARAGLAALPEFAPVTTELDEYEKQKKAAAQKGVDRAGEGLTREQKFQAEMGEYGAGKEKRLKEREAKLGKDEKSNYGLAFLEAGLAMMGGKDQNAFANISTGALKGLGSYKTGLAKLNDRKEKLFDAYDSLEDARRSDKKDRFARIEAAQDKISSAQTALENVSVDVLGKKVEMNADIKKSLRTAIVDTANTEYGTRSRAAEGDANRATNADLARYRANTQRATTEAQIASQERVAAMPKGQERLFAALADPTSNVAKGMAAYAAAMGKDKDTATADFVRYVEAATKNADPTNPPNMDTLLQQFLAAQQRLGGAKMTSSLPPGAQTVK